MTWTESDILQGFYCFDAVGWLDARRASRLYEVLLEQFATVHFWGQAQSAVIPENSLQKKN